MRHRSKLQRVAPAWLAGALVLALAAPSAVAADKDIVEVASEAGSFQTLLTAAKAAGLVEALQGEGPLTVFAPTDEAFAKLPEGTVASLLKPENTDKLATILTYHVVPGRVRAKQALRLPSADTLAGPTILLTRDHGGLRVDQAKVVQADIEASNGIIHVIDEVILPKDIVGRAKSTGTFGTLLAAAKAAGLVEALQGQGPLTVFAPTDAAFAKLPEGTVESLLEPANRSKLASILKYHVVSGSVVLPPRKIATLQGESLRIAPSGGMKVNGAGIALANVKTTNGVIHVIDRVLLPGQGHRDLARETMQAIERTIARGAPMFNAGDHKACADAYETLARRLLAGEIATTCDVSAARLRKALDQAGEHHNHASRAWVMRHALDEVYRRMAMTMVTVQ
jgi:uncharacterized surface protein with fasciclin (FAS1) repeats